MARRCKCSACQTMVTALCLAQYRDGSTHAYLCPECHMAGIRCWYLKDGTFRVSAEQPKDSVPAALYWDEGGYVTGTDLPRTYPSVYQPSGNMGQGEDS